MTLTRWLLAVTLLLLAPMDGGAQSPAKTARIGVLWPSSGPAESDPYFRELRKGLEELGYVEGRTVTFEHKYGQGRADRIRDRAMELARMKLDVIVAPGTSRARAVVEATQTIPVVMVAIGDPVETGLVTSLGRPGGNVTGVTVMSSELAAKRLELLREAFPSIMRVVVLVNPADLSNPLDIRETATAAVTLGLRLEQVEARAVTELDAAFRTIARVRPDALLTVPDSFTLSHRARIVAFAAQQRLPAMYAFREFVDEGGLLSYGPSLRGMWRRAASYIDRIVKGARPADLPVEVPSRFELVVNGRTAKALGFTLPPAFLARADAVLP